MRVITVCFEVLFISIVASAKNSTDEWTLYTPSSESVCKSTGKGFEIRADFDGNKKGDIARLQINKKTKGHRVAVWMNGEAKPLILDEGDGDFLMLEPPGEIDAFDGLEGFTYKIKLPSIGYGTCEVSKEIFQWDGDSKKFKATWVRD